jgi:hypothetical protein
MDAETGQIVDHFLASLEGETRRIANGEWGLSVDAAGWPLHVGMALRDGLLQAQAQVVDAGVLDEHSLLFWNRSLPLVRFAHTGAGEVYVKGELPLCAVQPHMLDRFLGLLVRTATMAREHGGRRLG